MARYRCVRPTIVYVLLALSLSQESDSASMGQQNFEMRRVTTWPGTVESKSSMSTEALDDPGLGLESGAHNQEGQTFNSPISKDSSFALPLGENAFDTSSAEHRSPLSHILLMFKNQEQAMLLQAQRCRSAVRRLETLEAIMMNSREKQPVASTVLSEVEDWNQCALEMQNKLKDIFGGAGKRMALLLGEKEPAEESALFGGVKIDVPNKSDSLPDLARMVDGGVAAHPHKEGRKTKLKLMHTASLPVLSSMLSPQLEERFRVGTWNDIAVYGVEKMKDGHYGEAPVACPRSMRSASCPTFTSSNHARTPCSLPLFLPPSFPSSLAPSRENTHRPHSTARADVYHTAEYAKGTELHVIWDIDQTKLVGEGTNDVELVRHPSRTCYAYNAARTCYAMPAMCLRVYYAVRGSTERGYAGTRSSSACYGGRRSSSTICSIAELVLASVYLIVRVAAYGVPGTDERVWCYQDFIPHDVDPEVSRLFVIAYCLRPNAYFLRPNAC
eukprot:1238994-Rhodomonas_salina.2